jgi:glycerophosphoryl diester phosphodiesterase
MSRRGPSSRRSATTREVDGTPLTGWFTEDFTWAELSTLRARERLGALRQSSASFDDRYPVIRLRDLFALIDTAADEQRRLVRMVAEFKHASHFAALGLPLDELFAAELDDAGWGRGDERLIMEAFELDVLDRLGHAASADRASSSSRRRVARRTSCWRWAAARRATTPS